MKMRAFPAVMLACTLSITYISGGITAAEDFYNGMADVPLDGMTDSADVSSVYDPQQDPVYDPAYDSQYDPAYDPQYDLADPGEYSSEETGWQTEDYEIGPQSEELPPIGSIRNTESGKSKVEDFEILGREEAQAAFGITEDTQIPLYTFLSVPQILQKPELPTGCESVSLTMALLYEGFTLDKTTIANEFLIYNREDDNMALGYVGDPFSEDGAGCFAPVIAATAQDFFQDQGYDYTAYELTGSTIDDLLQYVAQGTPVILWTTMYMSEPDFTMERSFYNERTYEWYGCEHCVVLSGYDLGSRTLQINDPLEGIVMRDMDEFERIYNKTGQISVVLKNKATAIQSLSDSAQEKTTERGNLETGIQ